MTAPAQQQQKPRGAAAGAVVISSGQAQQAQTGLALLAERALLELLAPYDLAGARANQKALDAAVYQITRQYGSAASAIAAQFYKSARDAAGVRGTFRVPNTPLPPPEQVAKTLDWALGYTVKKPDENAWRVKVNGAVDKMAFDVGHDTMLAAVEKDRHAVAWARVPEPDCCYFCAMLATRGAVYRSEEKASFTTHDHCRCLPEPVFTAYEPTAQIREWQGLYATSTQGVHGMKPLQAAFRQAYDEKYSSGG